MKYSILTPAPLKRAARELQIWRLREQGLAFVGTFLVFVILGPFQTYGMPFGDRLLYWGVSLAAGWSIMVGMVTVTLRAPVLDDWTGAARMAVAVSIAIPLIAAVVYGVEAWLRPRYDGAPVVQFFLNTALVCSLIATAMYLRVRHRLGQMPVDDIEEQTAAPPFFDRLPPELGRDLVSFSMQDHYVEVTTQLGKTLILMSMGDALSELGTYQGTRIHRSHWIANDAYRGLVRQNGKLFVQLGDGRQLPVSRTYAATVRQLTPCSNAGSADRAPQ